MSLLQAKCQALQTRCNDLRRAILGDMEDLRFELYSAGLISIDARQEKDAGRMVSEIENRLATDEAVWDKLIGVLKKCGSAQEVKEKLLGQLSQETGGESGAGSSEVRSGEARASVEKASAYFISNNADICGRLATEDAVIARLADALEGRKLITEATRQAVHGKRNLDPYDKVTMLMGPVKGKVEHNPELILKLIDAFRSCKLNELVKELEERMHH